LGGSLFGSERVPQPLNPQLFLLFSLEKKLCLLKCSTEFGHAKDHQLFQPSSKSFIRLGGGETRDVFDVCLELFLLFSGHLVVLEDELKDGDCLLFKEVHVFPLFFNVLKGGCWNDSVESLFPLCDVEIEKKSNLEMESFDGLIDVVRMEVC